MRRSLAGIERVGNQYAALLFPPICLLCHRPTTISQRLCSACELAATASEPAMRSACLRCGYPGLPNGRLSGRRLPGRRLPGRSSPGRSLPDRIAVSQPLDDTAALSGEMVLPCQPCSTFSTDLDAVVAMWTYRDKACDAIISAKYSHYLALADELGRRLGRHLQRRMRVQGGAAEEGNAASLDSVAPYSEEPNPEERNAYVDSSHSKPSSSDPLSSDPFSSDPLRSGDFDEYSTINAKTSLSPFDFATFVPSHFTRQWSRGGSGVQAIATATAGELGVRLIQPLYLTRRIAKQAWLDDSGRRDNVAGAFAIRKRYGLLKARSLQDRHILLIDDVLTTGATGNEVARVLQAAGAARVTLAVVARSIRHN